ncbi:glycosyltransferase family 2 protein [Patescibacteria group bacterium]|nr:glycosyltransferase family 2 protein [Patescibacteria group bacterium]MBU1931638.1 glycosyltransferase family 2 protein [Patescibacteria group bacterium]
MKLSIIIVAYNSQKDFVRLLPSIFTQKKAKPEVIVVDNASTDKTVSWLKKHYPKIKVIANQQNRGFGTANNQGIKAASNDLLFLLNPDTRLQFGCLEQIISWFTVNPDKQIAGCQLLNPDGSIQPSGGFNPTLFKLFCWAFFIDDLPIFRRLVKPYQARDLSFYQQERQFDWLMGAALIFRRPVFKQIGYFDEHIFLYGEEVELLFRAQKAKIPVWFLPQAKVMHWGYDPKQSLKESAVLGEYQALDYFFRKHRPAWQCLVRRLILKSGAFLRAILFGKITHNKEKAKIYEKAWRLVK